MEGSNKIRLFKTNQNSDALVKIERQLQTRITRKKSYSSTMSEQRVNYSKGGSSKNEFSQPDFLSIEEESKDNEMTRIDKRPLFELSKMLDSTN